jgi:uncharacterized protein YlxW (UPF0749 family)
VESQSSPSSPPARGLLRSLSLIALGAFLGALLLRGVQSLGTEGTPQGAMESAGHELVARLEQEQEVLRQGVETRRRALAQAVAAPDGGAMLSQLEAEVLRERQLAGLTDIEGPGLEIVLADGDRPARGGEAPENFVVHDYDLRDLVNALWAAGAEAICVGEERITFGTSIYCVGSTIVVGERRVSPPLSVRAIGDPVAMERVLTADPELAPLHRRAASHQIRMVTYPRESLGCVAYAGAVSVRYARIGE